MTYETAMTFGRHAPRRAKPRICNCTPDARLAEVRRTLDARLAEAERTGVLTDADKAVIDACIKELIADARKRAHNPLSLPQQGKV